MLRGSQSSLGRVRDGGVVVPGRLLTDLAKHARAKKLRPWGRARERATSRTTASRRDASRLAKSAMPRSVEAGASLPSGNARASAARSAVTKENCARGGRKGVARGRDELLEEIELIYRRRHPPFSAGRQRQSLPLMGIRVRHCPHFASHRRIRSPRSCSRKVMVSSGLTPFMKKHVALTTLAALAAGSAVTTSESANRQGTAQRTIDETFLCSTNTLGRSRNVTVRAHRGTARSGTRWLEAVGGADDRPGTRHCGTDSRRQGTGARQHAGMGDGRRTRLDGDSRPGRWLVSTTPSRSGGRSPELLICPARVSGRVPLTAPGLVKRTVGPFDVGFKCNGASARVFVRMRATLASRVKPKRYRQFQVSRPRSQGRDRGADRVGESRVYAEVLASGKSRLLTAKSCTPS